MTPCVLWQGKTHDGYGIQSRHGECGAHRVAYTEAFGPIPEGRWVLHRCDNRACINVEHLYLGDNTDNVRDRQARGRQARGLRHGLAKLSDRDVANIRALVAQGFLQRQVAEIFKVSRGLVSLIVRNKRRAPREYTDEERAYAAASMRRSRRAA